MALMQINFMSQSLWRVVPFQVILPVDKPSSSGEQKEQMPFKTLYLLHGLFGNYTDWVSSTRLQRWAEEKNLAVVMPSGDNSFYVDRPESNNHYGEFVGKELVEVTRRMFPLSHKREDTYIGGLSMGGFGALRNGLKYSDTFGAIIGLSSAIHIFEELENFGDRNIAYEESLFGKLKEAALTDVNPRVSIMRFGEEKRADESVSMPKIYLACGTEDSLLIHSRTYHKLMLEQGFDVTYEEAPGMHNWDFWDVYIKKALEWLPLEKQA